MSQLKQNPLTDVETADSRWNWLYRVAGVASLISLVIIPIQVIICRVERRVELIAHLLLEY